jgi:thiamine kinase-like enzyme
MMLTERGVVPYLLKSNLVNSQAIVEGDISVVNVSRRNRNFKVISAQGPCYLLKQGVGQDGIATVAHEAAVYQLLQAKTGNGGFDRYVPRFYRYNSQENILILELLGDALNLREYHTRRGRFSTTHAKAMGKALGTLHCLWQLMEGGDEKNLSLSRNPPWVLSLHSPELGFFRNISSANIQLIKIIQQFPEFGELLDRLRREWRIEALIHYDIKWDNCIVFTQSPSGRKTRLKIIDWELASVGDPCWDVGSVFNDYLSYWLLSIPITGETPPEQFLELARYPLERMQPAIRSFWHSYVRKLKLDTSTANQWLLRAVQYGAARLVQTAFEQMQMSMQLTGNIICVLQLSLNILKRPQEASVQLLGIPFQR